MAGSGVHKQGTHTVTSYNIATFYIIVCIITYVYHAMTNYSCHKVYFH